jgi:hypothetical protein
MSKIIYWACDENEWLRAKKPEPIYKNFIKDLKGKDLQIEFCPSVKDYMHNIFSIKSLYDYNFKLEKNANQVSSDLYNQDFFNTHVIIRSQEEKCFSFTQRFIFFTEDKSLIMSAGIFPFLENNNITKRCVVIPGMMDIGKWFRKLDFAFYLKNEYDTFQIEEDEIFQYIKFDTKEKIEFKQFKVSKKLFDFLKDIEQSKESRKLKIRILDSYYKMFNNKKQIIKEIKENLI